MRVFGDCYELMSEVMRDVYEMGHKVHPHSMQNKIVKDDDNFETKEIINYSYCLTSMSRKDYLFIISKSLKWAMAEFEERIESRFDEGHVNPGEAWKLRPEVWKQFINEEGKFDYTYNERIDPVGRLYFIVDELKTNPDSRQCVLPIFYPRDLYEMGGQKRIPCSLHYQFLLRDGRLNIVYNQRSADVVTHFGNDVFLAWMLMSHVAKEVGVKEGYLFHNIASLHAYKKDWPTLKKSISDIKDAQA